MKRLLLIAAAALGSPASAFAADATLVTRDVPLRGERALAAAAPTRFELVGLHWQGAGGVEFRTRSAGGRWSPWRPARPEAEDLPDAGTPEARRAGSWKVGNPYWVGPSTAIRYRLRGRVARLRAHFVTSAPAPAPPRALSLASSPPLIPRSGWKADESIRRGTPSYAPALRFAVVHHTAGSNTYTAAQSPAIVRAIQLYHVRGNGWHDIGYNFLVDKYGQVFEGRFGGVDANVVGAHAGGFNTGSVGVAVLGAYGSAQPTARALDAISNLLAWRLDVGHVDPFARLSAISAGNARFPAGTPVPLPAISGHRDTGFTSCPGDALYRQLATIARKTGELGLPKLYEPVVNGRPGEAVRFTARLSAPRAWTVSVHDAAGARVAVGRGEGVDVDWTWDATAFAQGRYTYTIDAGSDVRPATGVVGQRVTTLSLSGARALPRVFTPNGDSVADSTLISYSISLPASVTATLRDAFGQTLATLFTASRSAGRHSFRFSAQGIADGRYTVVLEARTPGGQSSRAEIPIVVDRTLAALRTANPAISPNGDRRNDELVLSFVLAAAAQTKVRIVRGARTIAVPFDSALGAGEQRLFWSGRVAEGAYAAVVEVSGPFGVRAQTVRFSVDVTKPKLRLLSAPRLRFSATEAGTLVLVADGRATHVPVAKPGWVVAAIAPPPTRFAATLWDVAGNRSAAVRYP